MINSVVKVLLLGPHLVLLINQIRYVLKLIVVPSLLTQMDFPEQKALRWECHGNSPNT